VGSRQAVLSAAGGATFDAEKSCVPTPTVHYRPASTTTDRGDKSVSRCTTNPNLRRPRRITTALAAGAVATGFVATAAVGTLSAAASLRPAGKLNCSLVSTAKLSSLTGLAVTKVSTSVDGSTTTCFYTAKTGGPILQYTTGASMKSFAAAVAGDKAHSESTTSVKGYGSEAVEITVGKLPAGFMVIKGSSMFLVTAIISLPKLEAVANYVLPSL
jgi:hypothetical protein